MSGKIGRTWKLSEATKAKHRARIGPLHNRWGSKVSNETKEKMSASHRGRRLGALNNFWKGGITPERQRIYNSVEYIEWRKSVFKRDAFTCQGCGCVGGKLQADHIKPFSLFPELRFETSNGRTLCLPCHKGTPTYAGKVIKFTREMFA
ncbi:MAG: HNH endonuclease [Candidatus Pacebacteria bacterium]|nr:HNH endonuclease [Candidatus Paceibacterota bacterium]